MKTTHLFLQLVQIDSPSGHETQMSQFIQTWLTKNKFVFKIDKVGNIYASNHKPGQPLLLCAHMDTVQPGIGIKPIIKNGVIKSSGNTVLGADNKAALAAMLTAIETIQPNKALELLFTVKEETGGGIEYFPFEWIKAKKGLIFDSSNPLGGIILQSPNILNFHIVIKGKAAHASLPMQGINAFTPTLCALQKIKVGEMDNGKTTINIGKIHGGTGINTIPDSITIIGEVRSYNKELFKNHLAYIEKIFAQEARKAKCKMVYSQNGYCGGYNHPKTDIFITHIEEVYDRLKLHTVYYEKSGISDANVLNDKGIQTVNLSDGTKHTHTKDEQIAVADLEKLTQVIIACINIL